MLDSLLLNTTEAVTGLPTLWQWAGVMLVSMIPFIESYGATAIGLLAGISPVIAVLAAVVGNIISMLLFVSFSATARSKVKGNQPAAPLSKRRARLKTLFDKYGVAVVSLVGQTVLPSQITSAAMVSFGASRQAVVFWQIISITLWGIVVALVGTGIIAFAS